MVFSSLLSVFENCGQKRSFMFDIFMYFADLNDSYFILLVSLAAAMKEEEDVSYMFFFLPGLSYKLRLTEINLKVRSCVDRDLNRGSQILSV